MNSWQKRISGVLGVSLLSAAIFAPSAGATGGGTAPPCGVPHTHTVTQDMDDGHVSIDFTHDKKWVEVDPDGRGPYKLISIETKLSAGGAYTSHAVGDGFHEVDVNVGATIHTAKVVLQIPCPPVPTPTPTPSPTPVPTPSPTPSPQPTPEVTPEIQVAPGVVPQDHCSYEEWIAGTADAKCTPWQRLRFTVTGSEALFESRVVVSGLFYGQVVDWFALPSSQIGYTAYSPAFQAGQEWTARMEVLTVPRAGELHIVPTAEYNSAGEIRGEDGDTQNAHSTDPVGGDWQGPGADFVATYQIEQIPQGGAGR